MKEAGEFDKNQTDAKGRSTTRPSCRVCRQDIDGKKLDGQEAKRMGESRPLRKTIFTCPICEKRTIVGITVHIVRDHDHETGKGRAWVCDSCNTGLGRFKDSVEFFEKVVTYLQKYKV